MSFDDTRSLTKIRLETNELIGLKYEIMFIFAKLSRACIVTIATGRMIIYWMSCTTTIQRKGKINKSKIQITTGKVFLIYLLSSWNKNNQPHFEIFHQFKYQLDLIYNKFKYQWIIYFIILKMVGNLRWNQWILIILRSLRLK